METTSSSSSFSTSCSYSASSPAGGALDRDSKGYAATAPDATGVLTGDVLANPVVLAGLQVVALAALADGCRPCVLPKAATVRTLRLPLCRYRMKSGVCSTGRRALVGDTSAAHGRFARVLTGDALANVVGMAGLVALACLEGLAALCASEGCDGSGTSSPVL